MPSKKGGNMSVCSSIKSYALKHEWLADLFSVLAVVLLFATVWAALTYNTVILAWLLEDVVLHVPLAALFVVIDMAMILLLLSIGSIAQHPTEKGCFHTFKGRRHGGISLYNAFSNWLHHMEHVGKKHR